MRIVIAGSNDEAFYLVDSLLRSGHDVSVVCDDHLRAMRFDEAYGVEVIEGDPSDASVLADVSFNGVDVVISLCEDDADNLVVCQTAKEVFGVSRTVCTVRNPRNVEVFKRLGVSIAISGTHLLARVIGRASTMDDVSKILRSHGRAE
ncbi:MAG: NAD-binding protein [Atopobiaceae bacterium]|jgi:trk system potassium uptake protein TrkA|nr:NAD-binding protein [Atopobiaceae bacterium]MCI2173054.1 NAD-binding protein [Atopobiaceae bacterium]MCI2208147.1 NAD-binding protein [Atopobiaceae bacterium]